MKVRASTLLGRLAELKSPQDSRPWREARHYAQPTHRRIALHLSTPGSVALRAKVRSRIERFYVQSPIAHIFRLSVTEDGTC